VVFMSGYSNGLLGSTHILDDDITFLEKPFTATGLLTKVAEACGQPTRATAP
jgi:two-component system, cell cycle sensor histidine kinase and response regulator CckA